MYVRVLSSTRLALGKDPMQPTWTIDLSKEHIVPYEPSRPNGAESPIENKVSIRQTSETRATRRSGDYWFELLGQRSDFPSLREMLRAALLGLEEARAGTLDKLSLIKPRSKRIVAREKRLLFSNDAQVDEYAEQLGNGWWFGTNNSAQETNAWLERACSCAGLKWGREFRTSLRESAPKEDAASAFVGTPSTSSPRLDRDITLSEEPAKLYVGDGSWRDDIYAALVRLGGRAPLREIYQAVRDLRVAVARSVPPLQEIFEATVRSSLEYNSSDSRAYNGGPDLFCMPEGSGAGIWAVREGRMKK